MRGQEGGDEKGDNRYRIVIVSKESEFARESRNQTLLADEKSTLSAFPVLEENVA